MRKRRSSRASARVSSAKRRVSEPTIPPAIRLRLADSGDLRKVRKRIPSHSDAERIARIFDAVADPARLRILATLERAPLCPCLLRKVEPMKNPALSYHLRVLKGAGLVTTSAKSNYRFYQASELGERLLSVARELL